MASPVPAAAVAEITETRGVIQSAVVFIDGEAARLATALAAALANGATAEELAPVTAELEAMKLSRSDLARAIAANPTV